MINHGFELQQKKLYNDDGYVIFKSLVPAHKIDLILADLEKFKISKYPYYSQSIHTWIKPSFSSNGFLEESMSDFTKLYLNCGLTQSGLGVLLGEEINSALQIINPKARRFVQWQNMLFDQSVGTVDHYDSYYLDTLPQGHLIGTWVALEDIDERCGPFKVYPKSHKLFKENQLNQLPVNDFWQECKNFSFQNECKLALLKKGDVLFWHPSLIHGSEEQKDDAYSRKSLTAHYYPIGYGRKGDNFNKIFKGKKKGIRMLLTEDQPIVYKDYPIFYLNGKYSTWRFNRNGLKKYLANIIRGQNDVYMDMKRKNQK